MSRIAAIVLPVGAVALIIGEMHQTVSTSEIAFELTPEGQHGQYQAFFGLGFSFAEAAGPLLLTTLVIYGKWAGWLFLGGVFLVATLLIAPVVDWALRSRDISQYPVN